MIGAALKILCDAIAFNIYRNHHLAGDVVICLCKMTQLPVGLVDCH